MPPRRRSNFPNAREAPVDEVYERDEIAQLRQQVEVLTQQMAAMAQQHQRTPSLPSAEEESVEAAPSPTTTPGSCFKCFSCGESGHRFTDCKNRARKGLFADAEEGQEEFDDPDTEPVFDGTEITEEERLEGDFGPLLGHMIPMIDIARLLAQRGVIITIVTTPHNAARFEKTLARAIESGLQIRLIQLQFPWEEAGLSEGCENFDLMPSLNLATNFLAAAGTLQEPVEKLFEELKPQPNCVISDSCLPYTAHIASKFNIPRISFQGICCFCLLCMHNTHVSKVLESITSELEYFVIPGLPDKVEFSKPQIDAMPPQLKPLGEKFQEAELATYGVIVNSFQELEPAYVEEYSKWLDLQDSSSVLYACLGSLCNLIPAQLMELGLGLEASDRPFIWVIREGVNSKELQKWAMENGFEERNKGRGLVIWGWAPQVLILSHTAIGGFLTHCGWNSSLEGISAGLPLITWPLFADQFCNEKLVVQILKIGVRVGVEYPMTWGKEEEVGVLVKREDVKSAVEKLMNGEKEAEERRTRARELGKLANAAVEEGGSSNLNIALLLEDIRNQVNSRKQSNIS
ncbi:hypothetical protein EZV62_016238 [Acer yangbiense]|uniref:Glycosyltransferase n=1 Tax=Acer yangbiense TaxID=1000413 RepID=A0A5C7HNK5_9ROSI|nr:hypothetical protein EZV62_016238 [Acer yangbiense]